MRFVLIIAAALLATPALAHTITVDFDDLSGTGKVPEEYASIMWMDRWIHSEEHTLRYISDPTLAYVLQPASSPQSIRVEDSRPFGTGSFKFSTPVQMDSFSINGCASINFDPDFNRTFCEFDKQVYVDFFLDDVMYERPIFGSEGFVTYFLSGVTIISDFKRFYSIGLLGPVDELRFSSSPFGIFTLDDITFTIPDADVPAPASFGLGLTALAFGAGLHARRRSLRPANPPSV